MLRTLTRVTLHGMLLGADTGAPTLLLHALAALPRLEVLAIDGAGAEDINAAAVPDITRSQVR